MAWGKPKFDRVIGLYHRLGGLYGDYGSGLKQNFNSDAHFKSQTKGVFVKRFIYVLPELLLMSSRKFFLVNIPTRLYGCWICKI